LHRGLLGELLQRRAAREAVLQVGQHLGDVAAGLGCRGLRPEVGPLKGGGLGGDVVVSENGLSYAVDVLTGDRTGFYLEHRLTRSRIAAYAKGRRVLDLFSYSGSFSVCALAAGAVSVASVDSSAPAQALLRKNMELNRIRPFVWRHHRDDAVSFLEADRDSYDLVLVDAPASVSEYREYRRVLDRAVARLGSPGILFVAAGFNAQFSGPDLLKAVHKSASGLSRNVRVLETLSGPADFPWLPSHPEGLFQGGFVLYLD
ncbi:MAG TPA: class I SAM-dependent methyltransferase, partial [Deltaproteobacteria bacterium]|nr:class I SAM-dependent methyltransferase [Deltaproteobacteria bacterium]